MFYKNRTQTINPVTKHWVKIDVSTGRIMGHKRDKYPYANVMTFAKYQQTDEYKIADALSLDKVRIKIDPKYAAAKIKCNCGHYAKEHFMKAGCCHQCGCTWYYPNDNWILKQQKKVASLLLQYKENCDKIQG